MLRSSSQIACPLGCNQQSGRSQIYAWEGLAPDVDMTDYTEARLPSEEKWYVLTGRVVDAKVEADGDIHLALQDADGNNVGTVSAEIPVGPKWCEDSTNGVRLDEAEVSIHAQERARPYNCRARRHRSSGNETGSDPMKYWEI